MVMALGSGKGAQLASQLKPNFSGHAMRIIFAALVLAFGLTTAMAVTMVVAYTG
jgi:hypothetical protein